MSRFFEAEKKILNNHNQWKFDGNSYNNNFKTKFIKNGDREVSENLSTDTSTDDLTVRIEGFGNTFIS